MEMNIFLCQSIQTQIELEEIADVKRQIITPATSRTIIGIVQDGLIGSYNLTSPNMRIDWKSAMNIMSYTSIDDFSAFKKNKDYTGFELFSMILPPKINVTRIDKDKPEKTLIIKNGILEKGHLTKDLLGSNKKNNLTQLIWDEYGVDDTKAFLDNTQRLMNNFNLYNGFTVGIGDTYVSKEVDKQIHTIFETKDLEVAHKITELENNPDLMDLDLFERTLFAQLNGIREDVSKLLMANLSPQNNFNIMISSGSKGIPTNMGQITGCVGLQAFEGKLVPKKINRRSLPYFFRDDDRSTARGLIKRPFLQGMTFPEFFFHNLTGREGLIDQAIKSVTGDTQIVILENEKINHTMIGPWIDSQLTTNVNNVRRFKEKDMELLNLENKIYIPTVNEIGKVTWGEITAITRHDPSLELYEIITLGGRKVIVTESKSLLIWNKSLLKFEQKNTPDVIIGDFVPVTMSLTQPPIIIDHIDMTKYFSKNDMVKQLIPEKFILNKFNGLFLGLFLAKGSVDILNGYISITNNDTKINDFVKKWFDHYSIKTNLIGETSGEVRGFSTMLATFLTLLVGHKTEQKFVPNEAFTAPDEFIIGLLDGYYSGDGHVTENSINVGSASKQLITGISMLCSRFGIFSKMSETQLKSNNIPSYKLSIQGQWARIFRQKISLTLEEKNKLLQQMKPSDIHCNFKEQNDVVLDSIVSINKIDITKYPKVYDLTVPSTLNFGIANGLHVVDTAESGYIQRKLIKSMEDIMIRYDGTSRTATGSIVQFTYGDSGADTTRQYEYDMKLIEMNNLDIAAKHKFTKDELSNYKSYTPEMNENHYRAMLDMRDLLRTTQIKTRMNYITINKLFMLPVNLLRIIDNAKGDVKLIDNNKDKLEPKYILEQLELILSNKKTNLAVMKKADQDNKDSVKYKDDRVSKTALMVALHDSLSPKRCIFDHQFNKTQFDTVMNDIVDSYNKNLAEPGEMIGIIAAQSLGEPTTQLSIRSACMVRLTGAKNYTGQIGPFIDELLKSYPQDVKQLGKDSVVLDLKEDYNIIGVSNNEKTSWMRISQVSRHPANGDLVKVTTRSGKETTATLSHSFLKRTADGIIPVKGSDLKVDDRIPIARYIPVIANPLEEIDVDGFKIILDKQMGWLCGVYLADGCIVKSSIRISKTIPEFEYELKKICEKYARKLGVYHTKHQIYGKGKEYDGKNMAFSHSKISKFLIENFSKGSWNKKLSSLIFTTNKEFISGIISGYVDGDGSTGNADSDPSKVLIRASSRSEQLICDMITLLSYVGVFATKAKEVKKEQITDKRNGDYHTFQISRKYTQKFKDEVGLRVKEKVEGLDNVIAWLNRDNKHSDKEEIDMIPELGETIAAISDKLALEGNSRSYKRFIGKDIGRQTLAKIIEICRAEINVQSYNNTLTGKELEEANEKELEVRRLKQAKRNVASKKVVKNPKKITKMVLKRLDDEEQIDICAKLKKLQDAYDSDVVWDKIETLEIIKDPKEYVYDFTVPGNDSFMVDTGILVHNTLNSVDWEETLLVNHQKENKLETIKIGKLIDDLLVNGKTIKVKDNVENEMGDTSYLDIKDQQIYIQSVTEDGKVRWKLIEAITRHLPMNKDGTNNLLEVKTKSGRMVRATKAKSFLTKIDDKILPIRGDELQIGTVIPIIIKSSHDKYDDYINLTTYCPNITPKNSNMPLDSLFGYYLGIVCQGEYIRYDHESIAIKFEKIKNILQIEQFCKNINVQYDINYDSISIDSDFVKNITMRFCGDELENRTVPTFAYNANTEFIIGFIKGVCNRSMKIDITNKNITIRLVSKELVRGLALLLTRFNIISSFEQIFVPQNRSDEMCIYNDMVYILKIGNHSAQIFNDRIICKPKLQEKLDKIIKQNINQGNNNLDILNDVYLDEIISIETVQPSHKYVYDFTIEDTKTFALRNGILCYDSFHHTGIAAISTTTQGVPRIKELLSLTKNLKTPQMILYPTKQYMGSRDMANKIASYIKYTTVGHLRERLNVYYDPDPRRTGGFMENDNVFKVFTTNSSSKYSCQADVESLPWLMRIEFNRESLYEKEVTLLDIKSKFCSIWEKRHTDKSIKKEEKRVFEKITQIAIISNSDYDNIPIIHIRFDMIDFEISTLNDFIDHVIDKFKLKGLPNISNISTISEERVLTFDNEHNDIEKKKQYVIYTVGVNLHDIRYLNGIDFNKTITNDVVAMYETFGIEAARSTLLREIIYAYERAGSGVNYHHVSVLIDLMSFNGYMTSVDRHGMNKSDVGPLSRASFEKTVDQLLNAAVFGEVDHMTGVSARIMAGLVIKGGTGLCNIILDTEMVQNSEFTEDIGQKYVKTYNDISENSFINDIVNKSAEDTGMFIPS